MAVAAFDCTLPVSASSIGDGGYLTVRIVALWLHPTRRLCLLSFVAAAINKHSCAFEAVGGVALSRGAGTSLL
jgi:hypothetical protein